MLTTPLGLTGLHVSRLALGAGPIPATMLSDDSDLQRNLIAAALDSLARAIGRPSRDCRAALIEAHHHDFQRDPFFLGAYSHVRPGGRDAARALAEPLDETLFFAGEALDREYPGTVAGALASGERAARLLLRAARSTSKSRQSLDLV